MAYIELHDGTKVNHGDLPETSLQGLLNRAMSHIDGNEVASQLVGYIRTKIAGAEGKASEVPTDVIKAYRTANPDEVTAKVHEFTVAKHKAIMDGTMGVRAASGASSVDPMTKEMLRIAKDEIQAIFKKRGWTFPTKDATFTSDKGKPNELCLDANGWVRRWLDVSNDRLAGGKGDPNRPRIEKLAQRNLQAKASLAKRVEEAQVEGEDSGL